MTSCIQALACIGAVLIVAQTGGAMWQDNFDDASAWSVSYLIGEREIGKAAVALSEDGRSLRIPADFRTATANRLGREINLPRPRWISFRLKSSGNVPVERLKLRLCLKSPDAPFSFTPALKRVSDGWAEFEADINSPLSLVNVWRFYGLRRLTSMTITIEGAHPGSAFDLFLDSLRFRYGEEIVENYQPGQIELRPSAPPSIAVCMNTAGECYRVEEVLEKHFPNASVSVHPFRGLHLPLDNWPPDLTRTSLVAMVDTDTSVLSDRELADLADYVHSGGALLIFAGPNSVAASVDGRPLAGEILPAEPVASARSQTPVSGALGGMLPYVGPMHLVTPKPGSEVLLSDREGRPAVVVGGFGRGKVALIACYPDASRDRNLSLFWSSGYTKLVAAIISRISELKPIRADAQAAVSPQPALGFRFPYQKRVFAPDGRIDFTVLGPPEVAGAKIEVFLKDTSGATVWEADGILTPEGEMAIRGVLPDLADGRYTLLAKSGAMESLPTEIVITPPLQHDDFYPIIARLPIQQGGHWLGPKTLKRMVEDVSAHGANTIAVPVLDSVAKDPEGFAAESAALLELYAQEKGMAIMYDYSHLPTFSHRARPPLDVRSPDAARKAAELAAPWSGAADLVPRLFAVKTIDEPTANFANLNLDWDGGKEYREKCGFDVPDAKGEANLTGVDRLNHWLFVADYGRRQFQVLFDLFSEQKKPWKLLHTFMEPGFGSESPDKRFEDVFAWGGTADYLDFDIYPYWYPESQKRRFAKVHYGFAFQRAVAQFYGKPMGFYVELDDRNYPFQKNPVEATGELAYTAVGEGCHYLNTFIYGIFGAGNMARPERWEDGGEDLRAIAKTTPFLLSTERAKARIALYFPYRQWIISGRYYPTFGLELFRRTFGECDLLHEEIALRQGLGAYEAVVLLQTDIIPASFEDMLLSFVESGGVLVLDHCPSRSPEGAALTKLKKAIGEIPPPDPWKPEVVAMGKGFAIKAPEGLDAAYRAAVEGDDLDAVRLLESWAGKVFAERGILPSVRCSDGEFEAGLLRGKGASALVVVNHHPKPAETVVELNDVGHRIGYVCDLATGRSLDFRESGGRVTIPVHLTQRQGVILGLYPKKPGRPEFRVRMESGEFVLNLSEPTGGSLPVFIEAIDPAGRRSLRHSRQILLTGRAEIRSPLAANHMPGEWKFRAVIPALGVEMEQSVGR